jgi:type IV pilus assembly protein PilA
MKNEQGFSLVELLIVVAIIAIIAAIAVPSLMTSRQAANEASATQGLRTIGSAEIAFAATNNQAFAARAALTGGGFLDLRFADPASIINGYTYLEQAVGGTAPPVVPLPNDFSWVAAPSGNMGRVSYGIQTDQVVRFAGGAVPAPSVAGDPIGKR